MFWCQSMYNFIEYSDRLEVEVKVEWKFMVILQKKLMAISGKATAVSNTGDVK